jgi:chromosome segregation ATPase
MNSDEKILKILEDIQANIKVLHAGQKNLEDGQKNLEDRQKNLEAGQMVLQADVKELHGKVDNVDLKAEAIHAYQLKAQGEIMGIMTDISEINGQEQKKLEERVEVLEEHAGIPHPDKN